MELFRESEQKKMEKVMAIGWGGKETSLDVNDKIYTVQHEIEEKKIRKRREIMEAGKTIHVKTMAEEMLEELEEKVTQEWHRNLVDEKTASCAEIHKKGSVYDPIQINREKLKG